MSEENQPQEAQKPKASPRPPVMPQVHREPAVLNVGVDKIDEITAYLTAIRSPERYNTTIPFVVVPDNMKALDLEELMPNPRRIKRQPKFTTADDFVSYVNDFKEGHHPRLFAKTDDSGVKIVGIIDYDIPMTSPEAAVVVEPASTRKVEMPQWGSHLVGLEMTFAPDYSALRREMNKWHDQEDFALFIEEFTHLFISPSGADMLEMAQDLRGMKNVSWKGASRLSNGQTQIEWNETVAAAGKHGTIEVPDYLTLKCALFDGMPEEEFKAAFRWRIKDDRSIIFSYRLLTKLNERVAQEALKKRVEEGTGLKPMSVSSFTF